MGVRSYDRLGIEQFGQHLLDSDDLDPVYVALHGMELPTAQLKRWCIAYWCLYHCGSACYISEAEGREFWVRLMAAVKNDEPAPVGGRWQRGHERRHFRGEAAIKATRTMMGRYMHAPEELVDVIAGAGLDPTSHAGPRSFKEITGRVKELPLFGPWIAFKVADMLDRLGIADVSFDEAAIFMFDTPTEAALDLWRLTQNLGENVKPKSKEVHAQIIHNVVEHLRGVFAEYSAPPRHERPIGLQEIETILCKWKSHRNGSYPLWNDIDEINHGLAPWAPVCTTAQSFLNAMPARRTV